MHSLSPGNELCWVRLWLMSVLLLFLVSFCLAKNEQESNGSPSKYQKHNRITPEGREEREEAQVQYLKQGLEIGQPLIY